MRIIVFFDLPTLTYKEQKDYRHFRKRLINNGFLMMQESVYCKLALNSSIVKAETEKLEKYKPKKGIIQVLVITEKQFSSMKYLLGKKTTNVNDSKERLVVI
ncbi:MAG: CRISPR-associated endonuclease Cas2 [Thomasclavelia sp.]|nr:CRISPR-associated endonuclease Cas2 [Thomasclavelia sp.]